MRKVDIGENRYLNAWLGCDNNFLELGIMYARLIIPQILIEWYDHVSRPKQGHHRYICVKDIGLHAHLLIGIYKLKVEHYYVLWSHGPLRL